MGSAYFVFISYSFRVCFVFVLYFCSYLTGLAALDWPGSCLAWHLKTQNINGNLCKSNKIYRRFSEFDDVVFILYLFVLMCLVCGFVRMLPAWLPWIGQAVGWPGF